MLTGSTPPDHTGPWSVGISLPPGRMRSTEIWLLPASAASTYLPSPLSCSAPWEPMLAPVPLPPATKGEPGSGVRLPSPCRSKPATVLTPEVLSLTYTWPVTSGAADAPTDMPAATAARPAAAANRNRNRVNGSSLSRRGRPRRPSPAQCGRGRARYNAAGSDLPVGSPVSERLQQLRLDRRRHGFGGRPAEDLLRPAELGQVSRATVAARDVLLEARALLRRERSLEVIRHQLDDLAASHRR